MKLKSIVFGNEGFRKLKNLTIPVSDRLTIISGHNGIGKSTILGLLANSCGIRGGDKSFFGTSYQAYFQELFYLDIDQDYVEQDVEINFSCKTTELKFPYEDIKNIQNFTSYMCENYNSELINNEFVFTKSCKVSKHRQQIEINSFKNHMTKSDVLHDDGDNFINVDRLKIVPRSTDYRISGLLGIGNSAKVKIPTIYLGMSRMSPIAEYGDHLVSKSKNLKMEEEDKAYIHEKFYGIINYQANSLEVFSHDLLHSKKNSKLPDFNHHTFSISVGQDSLSSIITALASFNKLKRDLGNDYTGGLLFIDEIDAGFHPRAQKLLVDLLKREARRLQLQIIATSHSLTVIKEILVDKTNPSRIMIDDVVYLYDTLIPRVQENHSYLKIKNDMLLNPLQNESEDIDNQDTIKIYFEDKEAVYFFKKILSALDILDHKTRFGKKLELIPLDVGCNIVMDLVKGDSYFKQVIIMPDNDVTTKETNRRLLEEHSNIVALPGCSTFNESTPGELRTPEAILYNFIKNKFENYSENYDFFIEHDISTDYVSQQVLNLRPDGATRDKMKSWFYDNEIFLTQKNIIKAWVSENSKDVDGFLADLTKAISFVNTYS